MPLSGAAAAFAAQKTHLFGARGLTPTAMRCHRYAIKSHAELRELGVRWRQEMEALFNGMNSVLPKASYGVRRLTIVT